MGTVRIFDRQFYYPVPAIRVPTILVAPVGLCLDTLALLAASCTAKVCYDGRDALDTSDIGAGLVAALVFAVVAKLYDLYSFQKLAFPKRVIGQLGFAASAGVIADLCLVFLQHDAATRSRAGLILFLIIANAFIILMRLAFGKAISFALYADVLRGRRAVLIGDARELERLREEDLLHFGFSDVARFGLEPGEQLSVIDMSRIDQAIAASRAQFASEFALVIPWSREAVITGVASRLRVSPLTVKLYPDEGTRGILGKNRKSQFAPFLSVELQREPLNYLERVFKRTLDIVIALCALACLWPILAVVALLILLDDKGPVLFKQRRRGFNNRDFRIWKFRTMNVLEDDAAVKQAQENDKRVTAIGRVLRKTSVDELPQLFNVLRGDMSIVGPRPHAIAHDDEYGYVIADYALRHHVKPGLTGAAQVLGLRGETRTLAEMEARIQADLWYINNWSPLLDVKIVLQTFWALFRDKAY
jgi:putative colanic acid biosynthesis UDP-glucose lipid carrier transferase